MMEKQREHSFEIGPIRPPSEGGSYSLLIRATRNCPWNRCKFCDTYKGKKFQYRSVGEIKQDIDAAKAISNIIITATRKLGYSNVKSAAPIIQNELQLEPDPSVINVFHWLYSEARTAFLQDADSLIMRTPELTEVLRYLKETFPSIERVTSYARAKTLAIKSLKDLKELREAGLARLHVGLETGDDELLKYIDKGVTSEEHVLGCRKAKEAGFELSVYVMPGLGGRARWREHAKNTAKALNEINPDFIRFRPYIPRKGTLLSEEYERGDFQLSSPHERLREIRMMVEDLHVTGRLCFDHFMNSWYRESGSPLFKRDYDGYKFPEEKGIVLKLIEEGLEIDQPIHVHAKDMIELPHL